MLLAVGDSGFTARGLNYVPLLTASGAVRVRLGDHFEFGGGGQVAVEPFIAGNRNSSYVTPGVRYEDYLRQEVLRRFVEENPLLGADQFPRAVASTQTNVSWRAVGYLGFGKLGPLEWTNFFARSQRLHFVGAFCEK